MNLTKRQGLILDFINNKFFISRLEIEEYIASVDDKISKITVIRDLDFLLKNKLIKKEGKARNVHYLPYSKNELFIEYDIDNYFKIDVDNRNIKYLNFNFEIFKNLKNIFSTSELKKIENMSNIFSEKIAKLPPAILKKEYERLLIELSWKSSQIEGNTYSLLDTEILIKENIEATGHKKEEAIMILNHKRALEFIFENKDYFNELSLKKIEELHYLLTQNLNVNKGLRKTPVGITGTNYKPLSNELEIKEAMEKLIKKSN